MKLIKLLNELLHGDREDKNEYLANYLAVNLKIIGEYIVHHPEKITKNLEDAFNEQQLEKLIQQTDAIYKIIKKS